MHPKVALELLRHSTIGLTMDIYTHVPRGSLSAALDVLPDLTGVDAEAAKATGTHDVIADNDVGNVGAPVGATGPKNHAKRFIWVHRRRASNRKRNCRKHWDLLGKSRHFATATARTRTGNLRFT